MTAIRDSSNNCEHQQSRCDIFPPTYRTKKLTRLRSSSDLRALLAALRPAGNGFDHSRMRMQPQKADVLIDKERL